MSETVLQRVLDRDRADGVDLRLLWLLDEWERYGSHVVRIAGGTYGGHTYIGGVRTPAQQLAQFNAELSKAPTPRDAPHCHAGALDVWPLGFVPSRSFEEQPVPADYQGMFRVFGEFAKARGFEWGGEWPSPDMPHVQVKDWRSLPCPHPDGLSLPTRSPGP